MRRFATRGLAIFALLTAVTTLVGYAVRAWSPAIDLQVMRAVASNRPDAAVTIAHLVSDLGSFGILAPLAIAFLLLRRMKRPEDDIVLIVAAVGSAALPSLIKLIVQRPRPLVEHLSHVVTLSFPSEHTTQAAAIYLAIAILLFTNLPRAWRAVALAVAFGLAVSVAGARVYLGVHYPTDVIAGLLLGWSWVWLLQGWAHRPLGQDLVRKAGPTARPDRPR